MDAYRRRIHKGKMVDDKGGWIGGDPKFFLSELRNKVHALEVAVRDDDLEAIRDNSADCGNFAMFIADNAGVL